MTAKDNWRAIEATVLQTGTTGIGIVCSYLEDRRGMIHSEMVFRDCWRSIVVAHFELSVSVHLVNMYRRSCAMIAVGAYEMEEQMSEVDDETPGKMER